MHIRATGRLATLVAVGATLVAPVAAHAAKPAGSTAGCVYDSGVVHASGLPTDQVINFMQTDAAGSSSWVLGYAPDGGASVTVGTPNGATTYQFISKTWGAGGSKYNVFATCSA